MKSISILGSTGSIGVQALDVIENLKDIDVVALSTNKNIEILEKQALKFKPRIVSVGDSRKANILRERLRSYGIEVVEGMEGLIKVATEEKADIILNSVVGMVGLLPTLKAIKAKKTIALANKETLVSGGKLVMNEAKKHKVNIIPIDSEHSAIFQCLNAGKYKEVSKIILTASGGPFYGKCKDELKRVSVEDALKHPNWTMGNKITIDSATLMNKGLEIIEAMWLFDVDVSKIEPIIHPQSIVHSAVEYVDGSIIAQLGIPDMRIPIQYALTYPNRIYNNIKSLNLVEIGKLTFDLPDVDAFPCLKLAIDAAKIGGSMTVVLNSANEAAVDLFLHGKIRFIDIPKIIEEVMGKHKIIREPSLEDIIECDDWARENVYRL